MGGGNRNFLKSGRGGGVWPGEPPSLGRGGWVGGWVSRQDQAVLAVRFENH